MEQNSVFDHLVSELTSEERRNLLLKVQGLKPLSESPMAYTMEEEEVDFDQAFESFSLWEKILTFLQSFFTRTVREEVIERRLLKKLSKQVQSKSPGLVDFKRKLLLPLFYEKLEKIKPSLSHLVPFLSILSGNRRAQFVAFLAAFEMESTTERFKTELDPLHVVAVDLYRWDPPIPRDKLAEMELPTVAQLSDADARRLMDQRFEDILAGISQEEKNRMYLDTRFLDRLSKLVFFPLERTLSLFRVIPEAPPVPCPFPKVADNLKALTEALCGVRDPIPAVLVEALVLFKFDRLTGNLENQEEQASLVGHLSRIEESFQAIRNFITEVPLVSLVKIVSGRINYRCVDKGGGEDWFSLFKQYWRNQLDDRFRFFLDLRRKDELVKEMQTILSPSALPSLPGKKTRECSTFFLGYQFLRTYIQTVFLPKYNRPLRILLLEGIFYKDDNRREYTEAFGVLLKLGEEMEKVAPLLEWDSLEEERKKGLQSDILRWSEQFRDGLISVSRVLDGILFGEAGGRYDTLSNLGSIGGRANPQLLQALREVLQNSSEILSVLDRLILLEKRERDASSLDAKPKL